MQACCLFASRALAYCLLLLLLEFLAFVPQGSLLPGGLRHVATQPKLAGFAFD